MYFNMKHYVLSKMTPVSSNFPCLSLYKYSLSYYHTSFSVGCRNDGSVAVTHPSALSVPEVEPRSVSMGGGARSFSGRHVAPGTSSSQLGTGSGVVPSNLHRHHYSEDASSPSPGLR